MGAGGWEDQRAQEIGDFTEDQLLEFHSIPDFHFCKAKVETLTSVSSITGYDINPVIYNELIKIGDSELGFNEEEKQEKKETPHPWIQKTQASD